MLGFVIGALSLYGLLRVLGVGRCGRMFGGSCHGEGSGRCHHGRRHGGPPRWQRDGDVPGGARWDGDFPGRGRWERTDGEAPWSERRGPGFWLRGLFVRLDTTPGQEKVMRQAAEELRAASGTLEGELEASRRDVAQAVRSGALDAERLGELFARHDEKLRHLRTAFVGALAKVTEALDEDQRRRLAELIDRGETGLPGFGGPYRNH